MKGIVISLVWLIAAFADSCYAGVVYKISLDTAPLKSNASGPFALDFQLTSGDTTSGIVNSATLSQFDFGISGASGAGKPFLDNGNTAGSLGSAATLNTSGGVFFNEFSQYFTPGDTLEFQLDLTNNVQPAATPDEFTFQLIDGTTNEVATTDPSGSNSLLVIDLTGLALSPQTYATNGDGLSISPEITSPAPEPGTPLLLVTVGAFFGSIQKLRLHRKVRKFRATKA